MEIITDAMGVHVTSLLRLALATSILTSETQDSFLTGRLSFVSESRSRSLRPIHTTRNPMFATYNVTDGISTPVKLVRCPSKVGQ